MERLLRLVLSSCRVTLMLVCGPAVESPMGDRFRWYNAVVSVEGHVRCPVGKFATYFHHRAEYYNVLWIGLHRI